MNCKLLFLELQLMSSRSQQVVEGGDDEVMSSHSTEILQMVQLVPVVEAEEAMSSSSTENLQQVVAGGDEEVKLMSSSSTENLLLVEADQVHSGKVKTITVKDLRQFLTIASIASFLKIPPELFHAKVTDHSHPLAKPIKIYYFHQPEYGQKWLELQQKLLDSDILISNSHSFPVESCLSDFLQLQKLTILAYMRTRLGCFLLDLKAYDDEVVFFLGLWLKDKNNFNRAIPQYNSKNYLIKCQIQEDAIPAQFPEIKNLDYYFGVNLASMLSEQLKINGSINEAGRQVIYHDWLTNSLEPLRMFASRVHQLKVFKKASFHLPLEFANLQDQRSFLQSPLGKKIESSIEFLQEEGKIHILERKLDVRDLEMILKQCKSRQSRARQQEGMAYRKDLAVAREKGSVSAVIVLYEMLKRGDQEQLEKSYEGIFKQLQLKAQVGFDQQQIKSLRLCLQIIIDNIDPSRQRRLKDPSLLSRSQFNHKFPRIVEILKKIEQESEKDSSTRPTFNQPYSLYAINEQLYRTRADYLDGFIIPLTDDFFRTSTFLHLHIELERYTDLFNLVTNNKWRNYRSDGIKLDKIQHPPRYYLRETFDANVMLVNTWRNEVPPLFLPLQISEHSKKIEQFIDQMLKKGGYAAILFEAREQFRCLQFKGYKVKQSKKALIRQKLSGIFAKVAPHLEVVFDGDPIPNGNRLEVNYVSMMDGEVDTEKDVLRIMIKPGNNQIDPRFVFKKK